MSSGSAITTGPGRPEVATAKARVTISGMRAASSISTAHLAMPPKKLLVVDLLQRLALADAAGDLADEQDHRR